MSLVHHRGDSVHQLRSRRRGEEACHQHQHTLHRHGSVCLTAVGRPVTASIACSFTFTSALSFSAFTYSAWPSSFSWASSFFSISCAHLGQLLLPRRLLLQHLEEVEAVVGRDHLGHRPGASLKTTSSNCGRHHSPREEAEVAAHLGVGRERVAPRQVAELLARPELLLQLLRVVEALHHDLLRVHLLGLVEVVGVLVVVAANLLFRHRHAGVDLVLEQPLDDQLVRRAARAARRATAGSARARRRSSRPGTRRRAPAPAGPPLRG